ncbi:MULTISPECIES: hypothetical protein [Enterococcus]|uniref:Uncharacterized protein n=2 Tax=Enterococcus gallinarum TaxID=1353 RepID=A0ABD4HN30_ENTGA|nr:MULTISPECIES: hypothetical protein [Enterococcus]MBA0947976.1 hypothetical protein [Enterococcus gallinarum]MBA0961531.1 hypothetical protein [Enterococcus gallinarum]MBA0969444.1 hypothetical protein [Enterococcus gallinarum]MBA0972817.1 hypothetical protein [Enterococcus gallinarum]NVI94941.1 hypothetical protein [Enterococcus gallinarum]
MENRYNGNLISIDSKRKREWTVIVLNHFSKELVGFLCEDASADNLQFTQRKEELGIFTETEANEIIDSIHKLKDNENAIHKTNEETGSEDWVSKKYFDFEKARIQFE